MFGSIGKIFSRSLYSILCAVFVVGFTYPNTSSANDFLGNIQFPNGFGHGEIFDPGWPQETAMTDCPFVSLNCINTTWDRGFEFPTDLENEATIGAESASGAFEMDFDWAGLLLNTTGLTTDFYDFDPYAYCPEQNEHAICFGNDPPPLTGCIFRNDCNGRDSPGLAVQWGAPLTLSTLEKKKKVNTVKEQFRPVVALTNIRNEATCSGVAIADNWILTAAHCTCDVSKLRKVFFGQDLADIGTDRLHFLAPVEDHAIFEDKRGQDFCATDTVARRALTDIALVRFTSSNPLNDSFKLSLPRPSNPIGIKWNSVYFQPINTTTKTGMIVGFGAATGNDLGGKKLSALVKYRECGRMDMNCEPDRDFLIDGTANDLDACLGDSGGPLVSNGLAGIISRGQPTLANDGTRCGSGSIVLSLRDSDLYREIYTWIVDTIN